MIYGGIYLVSFMETGVVVALAVKLSTNMIHLTGDWCSGTGCQQL